MEKSNFLHVFYALLGTLLLAGIFYFPYSAVRNKTIDVFNQQQVMAANQAIEGIQSYFSTYEKALKYLVEQPSIIHLDESGRVFLEDFYAIHRSEISGISRVSADGILLATAPFDAELIGTDQSQVAHVKSMTAKHEPLVSEVFTTDQGEDTIAFAYPIFEGELYMGALCFYIPFADVAKRQMASMPLDEAAYALLFSRSGVVLYASDTRQIGKNLTTGKGFTPELRRLQRVMASHEQGIVMLPPAEIQGIAADRTERYGVYVPVDLPSGNFWSLLIVSPAGKVLATMDEFQKQWFLVTCIAVVSVGLLSFFLTTTLARGREEKRRRAFEEQLVRMLDYAPMCIALIDGEARVRYANKSFLSLVKATSPDEVTDHSMYDFIHPDSRELIWVRIQDMQRGKVGEKASIQLETLADGGICEVEITLTPFQLGLQDSIIVNIRDVTEAYKAEERQRRLVTAVEQVKESVVITTIDGVIEYVNAAFCKLTGYTPGESIGKNATLLWGGHHDADFYAQIDKTLVLGEVWQGKVINRRKEGTLFAAATTISPVSDSQGRITHFVSVKRDITHEAEFESRLRQAQKMEAIGTLAGGIAHDFNNILGGILGFTDMALLHCDSGGELHENLTHIRQGGKRAADLIQQILTFSRQSTAEKMPVMVAPMIKESLKLLRASLPATIEINRSIKAPDAKVIAAPVQIQQIVMNLCTNAFHAMREKGGTLTLTLEKRAFPENVRVPLDDEGSCLCLMVQDTGTGMEDKTLEQIFTPFFTTKEPGEGTGMGLSVVHGIVEELDGDIQVDSVSGEGSIFTVYLPQANVNGDTELTSSEAPLQRGSEHILVVDDEKEIRETTKRMLEYLGYRVTTTGKAAEALSLVEDVDNPIDLVITDQTMPKMTGTELTREILKVHQGLPVILCTGYSDKVNYQIARQSGARRLLMKPVDLQGLSLSVRTALDLSEEDGA